MFITVILFLTIFFLPRLIVLAGSKIRFLNTLGPVFLCYFIGLLLSFAFKAAGANMSLASDFASVLVCIGMPLILFSADLPSLRKLAKPMIISYGMNVVAVIITAVAAFFVFKGLVSDAQNVSGMLIGDYTGITANVIAIGNAMGSSMDQILLLQTTDMIVGGIYFFLLLSPMPLLLKKILPAFKFTGIKSDVEQAKNLTSEFSGEKQSIKPLKAFLSRVTLVGLAVLCAAVAMGICLLLPSKYDNTGLAKLGEYTAVIMLLVTTFGVALSFVKKVRNAHGSYSSGQYFLLMFATVMGLSFDLSAFRGALALFGMLMFVQFGAVILHIIMAKIGKIDYHTMMITSTAGIFGPPFIIPVANALKNDEIILPGILCAILGCAIGNYLGIGIGELLRLFA